MGLALSKSNNILAVTISLEQNETSRHRPLCEFTPDEFYTASVRGQNVFTATDLFRTYWHFTQGKLPLQHVPPHVQRHAPSLGLSVKE